MLELIGWFVFSILLDLDQPIFFRPEFPMFVSMNAIAQTLNIDWQTAEKYVDMPVLPQ